MRNTYGLRASATFNDSSEYVQAQDRIVEQLDKGGRSDVASVLSGDKTTNTLQDIGQTAFELARLNNPVFVTSFSEEENLLSQWRAYCPQGDGYSLGFSASDFSGEPVEGMALVKCVYSAKEANDLCHALIESWKEYERPDMNRMIGECMAIMAAIKHSSFAEEKEWRLVGTGGNQPRKFRTGRHGIGPFIEVPFGGSQELQLRTVCLGPNSDHNAAGVAIQTIAEQSGFVGLTYKASLTPFRG